MRLPRLLRFSLAFIVTHLFIFAGARAVFLNAFASGQAFLSAETLRQAFVLGARFDLRLILLLLLPILLIGWSRFWSPFVHSRSPHFWAVFYSMVGTLIGVFYAVDGGYFSYLNLRLNASILMFVEDASISANMVWQSYPVLRIVLGIGLFGVFEFILIRALLLWAGNVPRFFYRRPMRPTLLVWCVFAGLWILGVHGKWSQYPLRWSDAHFSTQGFASNLALNPVLHFFDTLDYSRSSLNLKEVREAYPQMAAYLGVDHPDSMTLSFERKIPASAGIGMTRPNLVVVYLESFSAYKTSLFGNPLKTTPHFDALAKEGLFFDRFFTPHFGTARSIFTGLTGIPDVETRNTSSRNPAAVNQSLLANQLTGYDRFYFLGGSTTWANIRGLLSNNIEGIQIREEGSFNSPRNDVWGISDKDLFLEANAVFKQQTKPFFAVIQTSGNHRPYTIPPQDKDFTPVNLPLNELKKHGFFALDELNSFRYMDYSIGKFIEAAKKEPYFNNTIFVFFGDHGITGETGAHMPKAWTDLRLSSLHVPLVFYAPSKLKPARLSTVASEVDVFPTLLSLAGLPYRNTTMGRDLRDPRFESKRHAFTIYHTDGPELGVLDDQFYYINQGGRKGLHRLDSATPLEDVSGLHPDKAAQLGQFLNAYHQTAQYLLLNNHKIK